MIVEILIQCWLVGSYEMFMDTTIPIILVFQKCVLIQAPRNSRVVFERLTVTTNRNRDTKTPTSGFPALQYCNS